MAGSNFIFLHQFLHHLQQRPPFSVMTLSGACAKFPPPAGIWLALHCPIGLFFSFYASTVVSIIIALK